MRKYLAAAFAVLLVAAAVFFPEKLSEWEDQNIFDTPHLIQELEGREEFSDSIRLTVPEKLLLLRGGGLSYLDVSASVASEIRLAIVDGEAVIYESAEPTLGNSAAAGGAAGEEAEAEAKEWAARLESVRSELRALQLSGALPALWSEQEAVELAGYREVLAIDNETQIGFTLCYMYLAGAPYTMDLTVDAQTGKILAFTLRWSEGDSPSWGARGTANFGSVWRDYWGMDSVNAGWYSDYVKNILVDTETLVKLNGDYNANADVVFTYDGQQLRVPLACWGMVNSGWGCSIQWNC